MRRTHPMPHTALMRLMRPMHRIPLMLRGLYE